MTRAIVRFVRLCRVAVLADGPPTVKKHLLQLVETLRKCHYRIGWGIVDLRCR